MKFVNRNKTHTLSLKYTDVGQDHGILISMFITSWRLTFSVSKVWHSACAALGMWLSVRRWRKITDLWTYLKTRVWKKQHHLPYWWRFIMVASI